MPIQVASTGLHKIFVPVASLESLLSIVPDFAAIESVSRLHGAIGMYCYSLESKSNATAHCRNFAPVVGIMEDSATGTSAAALSCVLRQNGILEKSASLRLVYEQGDCIGQPSEIIVLLDLEDDVICGVRVAGRAIVREVRVL